MPWLDDTDWEEWVADPLVERLRDRVLGLRRQALKSLRTRGRSGQLDEVRRAEQRVTDMEEFLGYLMHEAPGKLETDE